MFPNCLFRPKGYNSLQQTAEYMNKSKRERKEGRGDNEKSVGGKEMNIRGHTEATDRDSDLNV